MDQQALYIFVLGLLILGCTGSSKLSSRFNMPGLLLFLLIGIILRIILRADWHFNGTSDMLDWNNANHIGVFALSFILFSGGYESSLDDIKKVLVPGGILASLGVLLCALILGAIGYMMDRRFFDEDHHVQVFLYNMLFASMISSTDASAVFSILRSKKVSLKGKLKPLLEFESGSNDPMATFLTLFFLGLCLGDHGELNLKRELLLFVPTFFWKMAAGAAVGVLVAKAGVWLFNRFNLDYDGLYYVLGSSVVLLAYSGASLLFANGFMAVYVAGVYMGSKTFVFRNGFGRFSNAFAWLMQVILFTLLGFMANPVLLWQYRGIAVVMAIGLMFVARPIATFLCMPWKDYSFKDKVLVSWVGLRGGAPIMLATFPMINASRLNVILADGSVCNAAELMFSVVFAIVIISVAVQSFTIMPLARFLKLNAALNVVPTAPISFDFVPNAKRGSIDGKGCEGHADDYENNIPGEFTIGAHSDLDGQMIRELKLPHGVFVLMVRRGSRYLVPRGNTVVHSGDCLSVLATAAHLAEAEVFFKSTNRERKD